MSAKTQEYNANSVYTEGNCRDAFNICHVTLYLRALHTYLYALLLWARGLLCRRTLETGESWRTAVLKTGVGRQATALETDAFWRTAMPHENADQYFNKRDDLCARIAGTEPGIMLITEVLPKVQVSSVSAVRLAIPISWLQSLFKFHS